MKDKLPLVVHEIHEGGYHIAVDVLFDGVLKHMIVDTGASRTTFDSNRLELLEDQKTPNEEASAGLGTSDMESYSFEIGVVEMGKVEVHGFEGIALNLANINESYAEMDLPPVDGVLGGELLVKCKAVIDYEKMILEIHQPE